MEELFDHIPETVFFFKDLSGRYMAVNQSLVERCGFKKKRDLLGKSVAEVFPAELASRYAAQDEMVLRTGRPIADKLELHWYSRRKAGWCLTTKLPVRDGEGKVAGLAGISRDLRAPGDSELIPVSLIKALEYLETNYAEPVSPAIMARKANLSPTRFARLIKRIFRLPPGQLITQTRLAAASRLLVDTRDSVADVAHACGFYDHSAFSRAFRAATGETPSDFRASR
jgi:PAS domain S-box-containing protein